MALAGVFLAGQILGPVPYPPAALASLVVKAAPGGLATEMIERLGHQAIRLLVVLVHIGVLAVAGYFATLVRRSKDPKTISKRALGVGALGLGLALLLAFLSPAGVGPISLAVYLLAVLFAARGLAGISLARAFDPEVADGETPLDAMQRSRRRFMSRALTGVVGLMIGGWAIYEFLSGRTPIKVDLVGADLPFKPPPDDTSFPEVEGLSPEVTSNADFYTVDINILKPNVDHQGWTLNVHGLVSSAYDLNYTTLQSDFEVVEMAHTLTCISNEVGGSLISTAIWRGVRLGDVLDRAGLTSGVQDIVFRAADGYSDSITLEKALEETTLVVFGMNGEALPQGHGFPARIIVPGIYGMKNVKWLTEIEAVDNDYQGYWMVRGWSDVARVKTQSRIDTPSRRETVTLPAMIAGVAWAGDREIAKVEVSQDGGRSWEPTLMKRALSPLTWRLWATDLEPGSGTRRLLIRATDGDGEVQEDRLTEPHPNGASGRHTVEVVVG